MDLSPDDKRRIEEEEGKRLAEERYRAQVRAKLTYEEYSPKPPQPTKATPKWVIFAIAVLVGPLLMYLFLGSSKSKADAAESNPPSVSRPVAQEPVVPKFRFVAGKQEIADGQIIVKANHWIQYPFRITSEMIDPRVIGSFTASGGSGNDIIMAVSTAGEAPNLANGHAAKVFYSTQGRKTTDEFDLSLRPGDYVLFISNTFSTFSDKQVFLKVNTHFTRKEPNL
jgi:hypothetical protein